MDEQIDLGRKMRILIVEDEALISMMLEEMVCDLGYLPVGPCSALSSAMRELENETFDVAIVDINLAGVSARPFLDALESKGISFIISTGGALDLGYQSPRLLKPFSEKSLEAALKDLQRKQLG